MSARTDEVLKLVHDFNAFRDKWAPLGKEKQMQSDLDALIGAWVRYSEQGVALAVKKVLDEKYPASA